MACGDSFTVVIAEVEGNPNEKVKVSLEDDALSLTQLRR